MRSVSKVEAKPVAHYDDETNLNKYKMHGLTGRQVAGVETKWDDPRTPLIKRE